jgi:hypothetical protein
MFVLGGKCSCFLEEKMFGLGSWPGGTGRLYRSTCLCSSFRCNTLLLCRSVFVVVAGSVFAKCLKL